MALGLVGLDYLGPQHTCSAELGNLHEVVGADTHVELDFLGYLVGGNAGLGEGTHVFVTPSQCVTQLLIAECAAVSKH